MNPYLRSAEAEYYAKNPEEYKARLEQQQQAQRRQGALRVGAGALDFFGGRKAEQEAESQIEDLGGQADKIRQELGEMRAPGSMDSNTVAEATRNAAILGFQTPPEDPSGDLAAQAMALQSGADPSKLYQAAASQDAAQDAQRRAEAKDEFGRGLEMAQTDALNRFKQDYQQKAGELDDVNQQLEAAQQDMLLAQRRKQMGAQGAVTGAGQFAQYGGIDKIKEELAKMKGTMGGQPSTEPDTETDTETVETDTSSVLPEGYRFGDFTRRAAGTSPTGFGLNKSPFARQQVGLLRHANGGSVQQTPGEYNHDTNDMILMAQGKDGMLVDTGIRQTGGEYVIDPFDAGNMRQSFDKIDPLELEAVRTGRAELRPELVSDLMQMYDAVRFINEPQFADDYYEKKMNGYA